MPVFTPVFTPDFTLDSNYNKLSGFTQVMFGAGGLLPESDFNEMQKIMAEKLKSFIVDRFGQGFLKVVMATWTAGVYEILNERAFVNGDEINITRLTTPVSEGQTVWLDTWYQTVSYLDSIKEYGNQQSQEITNYLFDPRMQDEETSRRIQLQFNTIVTQTTTVPTPVLGHTYLKMGKIENGVLVDLRDQISAVGGSGGTGNTSMAYYSNGYILPAASSNALIGITQYDPTTDLLIAHINTTFMREGTDYTITGTGALAEIVKVGSPDWDIGSEFDYLVIKNATRDLVVDGATLKPASVPVSALAFDVATQSELNSHVSSQVAHTANQVEITSTGFAGNLDLTVTDTQKLAEAVDSLSLGKSTKAYDVGDTVLLSADTERSTTLGEFAKVKQFLVTDPGKYRFAFDVNNADPILSDIGLIVAVGVNGGTPGDFGLMTCVSSNSWTTFTLDATHIIPADAIIELYIKKNTNGVSFSGKIKNVKVQAGTKTLAYASSIYQD